MKNLCKLLVFTIMISMMSVASALEIIDVKGDYWAGPEIVRSIQNGYIGVIDGNKFVPEGTMTRSEFVHALLKVISRQNEPVLQGTTFSDITNATPHKKDVVLSEQIRMAFGYPDGTFKPNQLIDHNETMSMIANITKPDYHAYDITNFKDYDEIPIWAIRPYVKNVANGLYVNHPDELMFTPSNDLTRAEAAVLFDKLLANLDKVKEDYRDLYGTMSDDDYDDGFDKSKFIAENTLNLAPFARNHKVEIYDNKKIIKDGNILIGTNMGLVKARKDLVGHGYVFTAPSDVYTQQGTFLYPKGTEFYARVEKLGYSAWRSKPERSRVVFHKYSLPSGETYDMSGVPFTSNDKLVYVKNIKNPKKVKNLTYKDTKNKGYLIDCAHQRAPILDYKIKDGKTIYILLTGDMVIPQNANYLNLRTKKTILEEDPDSI